MKTAKATAVAFVIAAIAAGTWSFVAQDGDSAPHLINRPWVDRMTESPKEKINVIFLAKDNKIGVTVHGSSFRYLNNMIRYDREGDSLQLIALQDGIRIRTQVRTWKCDDAPNNLDLCMELKVRGKKIRFYSHTEWEQSDARPDTLQHLQLTPPATLPEIDGSQIKDGVPSWLTNL